MWSKWRAVFDPTYVSRPTHTSARPEFVLPPPVQGFLGQKMVRLRVHRIDEVHTYSSRRSKFNCKPFVRIHVLDLRANGRYLAKPDRPTYPQHPHLNDAVVYSFDARSAGKKEAASAANQPGAGAAAGGGAGGGANTAATLPTSARRRQDGKANFKMPPDEEHIPNSYSYQKAFPFVRPIETGLIPGIRSRQSHARVLRNDASQEARNIPFCPSQEKFHTFVLRCVRNISEAP